MEMLGLELEGLVNVRGNATLDKRGAPLLVLTSARQAGHAEFLLWVFTVAALLRPR